jgi:hypothetical protein
MSSTKRPVEEHKRAVREHWNRCMRGDFDPWAIPAHTPRAEDRMLAAMEYAAFQLGEINQRLARIVDLTEEVGRRVRS